MLKKRLIPILLLKNGRCVKGVKFNDFRDTGYPLTAARVYDSQSVDELVFLDITASKEDKGILFDYVSRTAEECFMPLTVGGGVRTLDDIRNLLMAGADKVTINTAAVENPKIIQESSDKFGRANIVVSIDVKKIGDNKYEVYTHSGHQSTGINALEWVKTIAASGAGEILLTSIDREGTMNGYDLDLIRQVTDMVNIPVIANGGVGTLKHLVEGISIGNASAVAAASIFHFTDQSPIKAKAYMKVAGIDLRGI
jgi:imidazole glycerol-phosphate synthase subunit HisF